MPTQHRENHADSVYMNQKARLLLRDEPLQREQQSEKRQRPCKRISSRSDQAKGSQGQRIQTNSTRTVKIGGVVGETKRQQEKRAQPVAKPRTTLVNVGMKLAHCFGG